MKKSRIQKIPGSSGRTRSTGGLTGWKKKLWTPKAEPRPELKRPELTQAAERMYGDIYNHANKSMFQGIASDEEGNQEVVIITSKDADPIADYKAAKEEISRREPRNGPY
jgi:hypothetical protein